MLFITVAHTYLENNSTYLCVKYIFCMYYIFRSFAIILRIPQGLRSNGWEVLPSWFFCVPYKVLGSQP